jgi:hypothetical protein
MQLLVFKDVFQRIESSFLYDGAFFSVMEWIPDAVLIEMGFMGSFRLLIR